MVCSHVLDHILKIFGKKNSRAIACALGDFLLSVPTTDQLNKLKIGIWPSFEMTNIFLLNKIFVQAIFRGATEVQLP